MTEVVLCQHGPMTEVVLCQHGPMTEVVLCQHVPITIELFPSDSQPRAYQCSTVLMTHQSVMNDAVTIELSL